MQNKDTTKSTFFQLFKPIFNKKFLQKLQALNIDKYTKKLKTMQLIKLLVCAQLKQQKSLRNISSTLNNDEFSKTIKLDFISASQISRRLRDLPPKVLHILFKNIITHAAGEIGFKNIKFNLIYAARFNWASLLGPYTLMHHIFPAGLLGQIKLLKVC